MGSDPASDLRSSAPAGVPPSHLPGRVAPQRRSPSGKGCRGRGRRSPPTGRARSVVNRSRRNDQERRRYRLTVPFGLTALAMYTSTPSWRIRLRASTRRSRPCKLTGTRGGSTGHSSRTPCSGTPQASRVGRSPSAGDIRQWPDRTTVGVPLPSHDAGIDLVAIKRDGFRVAIRCKARSGDGSVTPTQVQKFAGAAPLVGVRRALDGGGSPPERGSAGDRARHADGMQQEAVAACVRALRAGLPEHRDRRRGRNPADWMRRDPARLRSRVPDGRREGLRVAAGAGEGRGSRSASPTARPAKTNGCWRSRRPCWSSSAGAAASVAPCRVPCRSKERYGGVGRGEDRGAGAGAGGVTGSAAETARRSPARRDPDKGKSPAGASPT